MRTLSVLSVCVAVGLIAVACGKEQPAGAPPAAAPAAAKVPVAAKRAAPPVPTAQPQRPQPTEADKAKMLAWVVKMEMGLEKATPCKRAFGILLRTKENAEKMIAEAPAAEKAKFPPPPVLPPEAQFTGLCDQLPLPVQNCMAMTYYMTHPDECRAALTGLTPEQMAKFNEVRQLVK